MDRAQLELVDALAATGSLTAAARRLQTAQPSLSRRLAQLERQLGTRLFDRGRAGASPTPAGRAVARAARDALDVLERVDLVAQRARAGEVGLLRVGTTPTLGADVLPGILALLRADAPDLTLDLIASGDSMWLRSEVVEGRLDVALAVAPTDRHPALTTALQWPQPFSLVVAADHPLAGSSPVPIGALRGQPLVALRHGEGLRLLIDSVFTSLGVEPEVVIEATEREMLLPLVAAGLGATIVPTAFARFRTGAGAGLVVLPLDPPLERPVAVLHRSGGDDPFVRSFVRAAQAAMAGTPQDPAASV
jgi:DNA-binding transcriptional LysR family regulator